MAHAVGDLKLEAGSIVQGGANVPGWISNLGIFAATTTTANDSIKISSIDATALSSTNVGSVTLHSVTSGVLQKFEVEADVTINLTGAHFGYGTTGDLTDAILRVLAVNDNGTLKWGVALLGGRNTLLTTDTNATATSVNLPEGVLCNSAIASASNYCREIGYFRCNFDDTGGAAEDLWAVQTGVGDIVVGGSADGQSQPWNPGYTGFSANPTSPSARWTQIGRQINLHHTATAGTSNATSFTITQCPAKARVQTFNTIAEPLDNSAVSSSQALAKKQADNQTFIMELAGASGGWTGSGTKNANFVAFYEVGPAASFIP